MKNIFLVVSALLLLTSCDDWLDITPKGKIIPNEAKDFRLMLDQVWHNGSSKAVTLGYKNVLFSSDDMEIPDESYKIEYQTRIQKTYIWDDSIVLDEEEDNDWKYAYNQIYVSNLIVSKLSGTSDEEEQQLLAEAKIHRAFNYFILVNIYGKHYNEASSASDLGVPLLLKPDLLADLTRSTVKEVYDQIIKDIEESIEYLPELAEYNHRPSKAVAYGLMARVALFMGDYTSALSNAENCLSLYDFLYDFNDFSDNPWFPSVFEYPERYEDKEILFLKYSTDQSSLIFPSQELVSLYEVDDLRFSKRLIKDYWPPEIVDYIYNPMEAAYKPFGVNVAEVYLMRAECNARKGNYALAMNDVNTIREKRYTKGTYTALSASNAVEALEIVKEERRRELAFRGLRWFDLKRYNVYDDANISLSRTIEGVEYRLEANSNRWAFPIGMKYILKNPEIIQNPN
ncbi:RagB/SusD family nutrient uptake outer membrane protein [Marinifilum fragile]|uniref:RagB/SusD family nutrient uptake outer membrane protein n=1 Tax=Marinifilum fragile TaxID=570161 RepID=UPI00155DD990|nr:RagB/SusD family nutrient uptake outer membrane protein [Marinifilum fragile]